MAVGFFFLANPALADFCSLLTLQLPSYSFITSLTAETAGTWPLQELSTASIAHSSPGSMTLKPRVSNTTNTLLPQDPTTRPEACLTKLEA